VQQLLAAAKKIATTQRTAAKKKLYSLLKRQTMRKLLCFFLLSLSLSGCAQQKSMNEEMDSRDNTPDRTQEILDESSYENQRI